MSCLSNRLAEIAVSLAILLLIALILILWNGTNSADVSFISESPIERRTLNFTTTETIIASPKIFANAFQHHGTANIDTESEYSNLT